MDLFQLDEIILMSKKQSKNSVEVPKLLMRVEVQRFSNRKYEYKEELGGLILKRRLRSAMGFPTHYGAILNTKALDGDELDVFLIYQGGLELNTLLYVYPVCSIILKTEDGTEEKIFCIPSEKISHVKNNISDLSDLDKHFVKQVEHFLENYKELDDGKFCRVVRWCDLDETLEIIKKRSL